MKPDDYLDELRNTLSALDRLVDDACSQRIPRFAIKRLSDARKDIEWILDSLIKLAPAEQPTEPPTTDGAA